MTPNRAAATPLPLPLLAMAVLATSPWAGTLAAQEPDSSRVIPVAPLTVTVLRTPVAGERVPYAVATAGPERLRLGKTGAFLEEALDGLPGVQVQNRFNYAVGERLAVRGFGARAQFGIRGVKILVDGIPATMPDGQSNLDHLDLATLGRVEVLRGPASALYGNAAGGVLSFTTRTPWDGPYRQELRSVVGSHGLVTADATATGTAAGTGYVVGVGLLRFDGFRPHPSLENETYGAADRLQLNALASRPLARGLVRLSVNVLDLDAENPGSLSATALEDGIPEAFGFNVAQGTGKTLEQAQAGLTWEGPAAGHGIELSLWGISRSLVNPIPPTIVDLDRRAGGVRALLRSPGEGGEGGVRWGTGVELEFQRDDRTNFDNEGGERGDLSLDQEERVRATGAFVQAGIPLGGRVDATAALRYDRFRFEALDRFTGADDPDDSGTRTMDAWSPSVGLLFEAAPPVALWANMATSLETPSTTELVNRPDPVGGFNPDLDPQRATTFEVGARGRAGDRLSWEVTGFLTRVQDELVPFEVPDQPGRTFFRNAGESRHEGIEAVARAALGRGVAVQLGWTRVDARFEEYEVDGEDLSGHPVPGLAPNHVEGLLVQERGRWFWALEAEWMDEVPVNDADTERADAYTLVDLRAGLREVSLGGLSLSPFAGVRNVLDEGYTAAVAVNAFGGRYYEPGPGRTAYVGATLTWPGR